jgi:hypothetical protein
LVSVLPGKLLCFITHIASCRSKQSEGLPFEDLGEAALKGLVTQRAPMPSQEERRIRQILLPLIKDFGPDS